MPTRARIDCSSRLADFRQADDGGTALLDGDAEPLHARYLIAADGARSGTREALGISRSGRGDLGEPGANVYFRADLAEVLRGRANTGIADVHNLAWKLAAVLRGQADPRLLDSYDAERRPAGYFAADQSARRSAALAHTDAADPAMAHPLVLALGGYQYTNGALGTRGALADEGLMAADPEPITEFAPAGRVGTRVPHRWLDDARTRSTLDIAGPDWAIVPGGGPLADFLPSGGHLLLRPDHIVAWRGQGAQQAEAVRDELLRLSAAVR